jgi:hypothetical protein
MKLQRVAGFLSGFILAGLLLSATALAGTPTVRTLTFDHVSLAGGTVSNQSYAIDGNLNTATTLNATGAGNGPTDAHYCTSQSFTLTHLTAKWTGTGTSHLVIDANATGGALWSSPNAPGGVTTSEWDLNITNAKCIDVRAAPGQTLDVYELIVTGYLPSAPDAPTGLTATPQVGSVALSWTAVFDATGYQVFRDAFPLATTTTADYVDTATQGTYAGNHDYYVAATNALGTSPASSTVTAAALPIPPGPPGTPTAPTATLGTGHGNIGCVDLHATAGAGGAIDMFRWYQDGEQLSNGSPIDVHICNSIFVTHGVVHSYYAVAEGPGGTSAPSAAVDLYVPNTPGITPGVQVSTAAAPVITWLPVNLVDMQDGIVTYQVGREDADDYICTVVGTYGTARTCTDTTAPAGVAVSYYINAYNGGGYGESSPDVTVTTPAPIGPPAPPVLHSATPVTRGVKLSWAASVGATAYHVLRDGVEVAQTGQLEWTDVPPAAPAGAFLLAALPPTYAYTIVASNSLGSSAPSNSLSNSPNIPTDWGFELTTNGIGDSTLQALTNLGPLFILVVGLIIGAAFLAWGGGLVRNVQYRRRR